MAWPRTPLAKVMGFAQAVYGLNLELPFSVTSWGRTPARDRGVGGTEKGSNHLIFLAVDVVFDSGREPEERVLRARARAWGLEAVREGDHWHLEPFPHRY